MNALQIKLFFLSPTKLENPSSHADFFCRVSNACLEPIRFFAYQANLHLAPRSSIKPNFQNYVFTAIFVIPGTVLGSTIKLILLLTCKILPSNNDQAPPPDPAPAPQPKSHINNLATVMIPIIGSYLSIEDAATLASVSSKWRDNTDTHIWPAIAKRKNIDCGNEPAKVVIQQHFKEHFARYRINCFPFLAKVFGFEETHRLTSFHLKPCGIKWGPQYASPSLISSPNLANNFIELGSPIILISPFRNFAFQCRASDEMNGAPKLGSLLFRDSETVLWDYFIRENEHENPVKRGWKIDFENSPEFTPTSFVSFLLRDRTIRVQITPLDGSNQIRQIFLKFHAEVIAPG